MSFPCYISMVQLNTLYYIPKNILDKVTFCREMKAKAESGKLLEKKWLSKLNYFQSKYPDEAAQFKLLLSGGMVPGWEYSLPV